MRICSQALFRAFISRIASHPSRLCLSHPLLWIQALALLSRIASPLDPFRVASASFPHCLTDSFQSSVVQAFSHIASIPVQALSHHSIVCPSIHPGFSSIRAFNFTYFSSTSIHRLSSFTAIAALLSRSIHPGFIHLNCIQPAQGSFWFGYTLKHRAVLVIRHAFGSLKNAQPKILLRLASDLSYLFLVNLLL